MILNCNSLDELLDSGSADEYPDTFGRKTHIERYRELAKKFAQFPVEMGAMQAAIKEWMDEIQEKSKDINKNENKEDRDREINKLWIHSIVRQCNIQKGWHLQRTFIPMTALFLII